MSRNSGLDRRSFLKSAGMTAALSAIGGRTAFAEERLASGLRTVGSNYNFDEIVPRFGTDCVKWDGAVATHGPHVEIGMGVADMDFRTAPFITQALNQRMNHENWGYLRMPETYVETISAWNQRRYGLEIDPQTVTLTAGVHPALISGYHAFAPPGSRVLLTTPAYNGFFGSIRYARVVAEESPMKLVDGRYSVDFEDFERRVGQCNVFVLCNPHNPTGNCWSQEDLMRMGQICLDKRVLVFADEIWADFVTKGQRYIPFASLPDKRIVDNSITFKAASKSFNLAAMKIAYYFSTNPDLLTRIRSHTRVDLNTLGLVANMAAMTEGDQWLDELLVYLDGNHDLTESYVRANMPLIKHRKGDGTFLAWLDVSEVIDRIGARKGPEAPTVAVQRWFADNSKVHLNPGSSFGMAGASHMRMNLGTQKAVLRKALANMAEALSKLA